MTQTWRVDDGVQTLVLAAEGDELPGVIYWGPALGTDENLTQIARAQITDITGGMLDALAPVTLCPVSGRGFAGHAALSVARGDGTPIQPAFGGTTVRLADDGVEIVAQDPAQGLTYRAAIRTTPVGVLRLSATLEATEDIRVSWFAAPVLPAPQLADDFVDISGGWLSEFSLNRVPWIPGIRLREAPTGRSGHEHFPGAILPECGATNTHGTVYALHYGWSGGHRMVAEELPDGRRQVQFGHAGGSERAAGRRFESGMLYATCASGGLNGAALRFQALVGDHLVPWPDRGRPRPVHYNCWEAVYFDHELAILTDIAERAVKLGAERFVLDDGWFGKRDDDTTSLGDWLVDPKKWPDGLGPLIDAVHDLGMTFGLWVEPEMVSRDSDLYRAHPDWLLGPEDQISGRQQYLLDLGRADVQEFTIRAMNALLDDYAIDYLKWDHNRVLPYPDAAQTRGFYEVIDRLRESYPQVEIESCASGGGRIDYGVLARSHRIWLSDSNDALERLRMQHDAALFLPASVTGSHVGPRVCHSSGRTLSMPFRAWVAAQRHMGFEMDLRELTDDETKTLADVTAWWKENRDWRMGAGIHRLDSADPAVIAEMQVSSDGGRFVVFAGQALASGQVLPRPLRLTGLDPDATYRITLRNADDVPPQSRGANALKDGPLELTGAYLTAQGIVLPWSWPETIWVIEGARL